MLNYGPIYSRILCAGLFSNNLSFINYYCYVKKCDKIVPKQSEIVGVVYKEVEPRIVVL